MRREVKEEEPAPYGYVWQNVKSFDENGNAIFKRELVKLKIVGGPTEEKDADEDVQKLADELKKQVEEKRNTTFTTFEAVKFTTQVVNGVIYKIKVKVGDDEYIHLRAVKNLPHKGGNVELRTVEEGTFKLADPLN